MTHGSSTPAPLGKNQLKAIILHQYALYEVKHHPSPPDQPKPAHIIPRAHTLIDIYKCLYQGEFSVGHIIDSPENFKDRLIQEFNTSPPRPDGRDEPLFENISTDHTNLRMNLRPYKTLFQDNGAKACDLLLQVCLDSAGIRMGNPDRFMETLTVFGDFNNRRELVIDGIAYAFEPQAVVSFFQDVLDHTRTKGQLPVVSHSPIYRRLNAPAYRVVHRQALEASPLASIYKDNTP
jgi:hypothetical protein